MTDPNEQEEWRSLIERLSDRDIPEPPPGRVEPIFEDPTSRKRVGVLITKAILGEPIYRLYQLYCGDTSPLV